MYRQTKKYSCGYYEERKWKDGVLVYDFKKRENYFGRKSEHHLLREHNLYEGRENSSIEKIERGTKVINRYWTSLDPENEYSRDILFKEIETTKEKTTEKHYNKKNLIKETITHYKDNEEILKIIIDMQSNTKTEVEIRDGLMFKNVYKSDKSKNKIFHQLFIDLKNNY